MTATDVSLWVPLASGALGIVGALAGGALTQRATRKREDRRWERERLERQRERRTALYVDLAEYTQSEQSTLDAATDEYANRSTPAPSHLQHPDRLTARVKLYATSQVGERWSALITAMEKVRWEYSEGDVNHNEHNSWLDLDNPAVVELTEAIKEMQSVLRKAIEDES